MTSAMASIIETAMIKADVCNSCEVRKAKACLVFYPRGSWNPYGNMMLAPCRGLLL